MARIDADNALGAMVGLAVGDAAGGRGSATDLALRLATTIAELGAYDPDDALRRYVAWYRPDPPAMTADMRSVLGSIAAGEDAYRATSSFHFGGGSTAGNGALVRATPIGVAYAGRDE